MKSHARNGLEQARSEIEYLIQNFGIHIESCRQSAGVLLSRYPKNEVILQIMAACQSLCGNHKQAIDYYTRCIELNSGSIAYSNNQAWNYLQLNDNEIALALLNDIKSKWSHPAIYLNLVVALQNSRHQQTEINAAFRMIETSAKNYPHYDRNDKPLIYTFLLQPQQYYNSQIDKFKNEIFQFVTILQNFIDPPFNYQFINSRLKQLSTQIQFRKQQQQKYGILIENQLRAALEALQVFRTTILYNYKEQYSEELNKYVSKSIEILNQNILIQPIDQNSDFQKFQNQKIVPCAIQLQQIAIRMKEIVNLLERKKHKHHEQPNPANTNYWKKDQQKPKYHQQPNTANINYRTKEQQKQPNIIRVYNESKVVNPDKKIQEIKPLYNPSKVESSEQQQLAQHKKQRKQAPRDEKQYKKYEIQPLRNIEPNQYQKQRQLKQDLQRDQDIRKDHQIKISQKNERKDTYQRPDFSDHNYQFQVRMDDIALILQEDEKSVVQTLRIEGENVASPLLFIVHFRKEKVDIFSVFLNKNRIRRELLNEPDLPDLSRLKTQQQRNQILKYYYILALLLRFYNYYATHNFEYRRKNTVSNLQIDHYIELITPVLNEIFNGEQLWGNSRVGWICNQIHFAKCRYVSETGQRGSYLQARNQMLSKIHSIVKEEENPAQQLVRDILAQNSLEYSDALLSYELKQIDGSTKYHDYFNWKMNRYHKLHRDSEVRQAFTSDDEWIISNLSILLIALSQSQTNQHLHLLYQTFVNAYYSSRVSQSTSNCILRKFYRANHAIAPIQEAKIAFRKLCRKILL